MGITYTGTCDAGSDYRLKENVETLQGNYYSIDDLRPVSYIFKDTQQETYGFIAHEVQDHFPSLVSGIKDGEKTQTLNYTGIIPLLVKEIQELKARVKQLEAKQ